MDTMEAARLTGLTPSRIRKLAADGLIPGARRVQGVRQAVWEIPEDWRPTWRAKLDGPTRCELAERALSESHTKLCREYGVNRSYVWRLAKRAGRER